MKSNVTLGRPVPKVSLLNYLNYLPARYVRAYLIFNLSDFRENSPMRVDRRPWTKFSEFHVRFSPLSTQVIRRTADLHRCAENKHENHYIINNGRSSSHKHNRVHAFHVRAWVIRKWLENRKTFDFELLEHFCHF